MNNFVFSQDPILYNPTIPQYQADPVEIKKQLDVVMAQYQQLQQARDRSQPSTPPPTTDYLGELDALLSGLDESDLQILNEDSEFIELNNNIQKLIQTEIMNSIKWKVNSHPDISQNVSRLKTIVTNIKKERDNIQKRNMNELNDYIQNYSDMTFNEYKKIKSARNES